MSENNLIYSIKDKPKKLSEWVVYTIQMVLAVFVATVLIAQICGTPISGALFGAFIGTLVYQFITGFKSPMFISSSGATVSGVIGALALSETGNYLMVACGGFMIMAIYAIFAFIIRKWGKNVIDKLLPPEIVGAITIVIGLNLAKFLVTYCNQGDLTAIPLNSAASILYMVCALITMIVTALVSHYGRGFIKNIPFLFGIGAGYIFATIITLTTSVTLIDFSIFSGIFSGVR